MPLVDVKSALLDLLDDLGLDLVEKGSTSNSVEIVDGETEEANTPTSVSSLSQTQGVNPMELKDLVASMVHEILSTKSNNQGVEQPLSEAPTEPLVAVETIENTSTPQELENAPEGATEPQNEVVEKEGEPIEEVEEPSQVVSTNAEEVSPTESQIDPLVNTSALMDAFGY